MNFMLPIPALGTDNNWVIKRSRRDDVIEIALKICMFTLFMQWFWVLAVYISTLLVKLNWNRNLLKKLIIQLLREEKGATENSRNKIICIKI